MDLFGMTTTGKIRDFNEDSIGYFTLDKWSGTEKPKVAIVADGMGGAFHGDIASKLVVEYLKDNLENWNGAKLSKEDIVEYCKEIIYKAQELILNTAKEKNVENQMGTTLVLATLIKDELYSFWCGDSRVYLLKDKKSLRKPKFGSNRLEIISRDHSVVWKQFENGIIDFETSRIHEMSNVITNSIGNAKDKFFIEHSIRKIRDNDKVILTSDGISSMISHTELENNLTKKKDIKDTCKDLIDLANKNGGHDNISIIIMKNNASKSLVENSSNQQAINYSIVCIAIVLVSLLIFSQFN